MLAYTQFTVEWGEGGERIVEKHGRSKIYWMIQEARLTFWEVTVSAWPAV